MGVRMEQVGLGARGAAPRAAGVRLGTARASTSSETLATSLPCGASGARCWLTARRSAKARRRCRIGEDRSTEAAVAATAAALPSHDVVSCCCCSTSAFRCKLVDVRAPVRGPAATPLLGSHEMTAPAGSAATPAPGSASTSAPRSDVRKLRAPLPHSGEQLRRSTRGDMADCLSGEPARELLPSAQLPQSAAHVDSPAAPCRRRRLRASAGCIEPRSAAAFGGTTLSSAAVGMRVSSPPAKAVARLASASVAAEVVVRRVGGERVRRRAKGGGAGATAACLGRLFGRRILLVLLAAWLAEGCSRGRRLASTLSHSAVLGRTSASVSARASALAACAATATFCMWAVVVVWRAWGRCRRSGLVVLEAR